MPTAFHIINAIEKVTFSTSCLSVLDFGVRNNHECCTVKM